MVWFNVTHVYQPQKPFIISKRHNQSKKQVILFTLAQIKYKKPQYIPAQEKYTVVCQRHSIVWEFMAGAGWGGGREDSRKTQLEVLCGGKGSDGCL